MKAILALVLVFAVVSADNHKYTSLVQTLSKMAQNEDEIEQVKDLIVEIRKEIQDDLNKLQNLYDNDKASYDAQTSALGDTITQLNQDISTAQTGLDNSNNKATTLQDDITRNLQVIAEAEAGKDDEITRRTDTHNKFIETSNGLQGAIQAAKDALELLSEAANQDLEPALIELNNKKINKHAQLIQTNLAKLKVNSEVVPMVEVLVELAAQGVNDDVIGQLQDLIENLIETLEAQLHDAVEKDNADDEYSRNAIATYDDTIAHAKATVTDDQAELTKTEGEIKNLNDNLSNFNSLLAISQQSLADAQKEWAVKSKNYEAVIKRLTKDIAALNAAEDYLNQQ